MSQEHIAHIYLDGRHYDRMFSGEEDIPFWRAQANKFGAKILELACGTGRISIALARAGFEITGIDFSEAMLKEARRKSTAEGLDIAWFKADMREFQLDERFSLIFLPANTLCHLLTLADFEACLRAVKRHLQPGGRFILDIFVPKSELLINQPGKRFPFAEYDDPDGRGRVVVTESYTYEPHTQIKRIKTYHAIPGEGTEIEGELNMRMYYPQELQALLKYNGFLLENRYGGYDQRGFDRYSEKQIIVSRLA